MIINNKLAKSGDLASDFVHEIVIQHHIGNGSPES